MTGEQLIIKALGEAAATGRFIGLDFVKQDGSVRTMTAKVDGTALNRLDKELVTVLDVRAKGFRSININSILYIAFNGDSLSPLAPEEEAV